MKRTALLGVVVIGAIGFYAVRAYAPVPIPADRVEFVGTWTAGAVFTIEIRPAGTARIDQDRTVVSPAWERLGIKVGPPHIESLNLRFEQNQMLVSRPFYYGQHYTIDKPPFTDGTGRRKMVLNGIEMVMK